MIYKYLLGGKCILVKHKTPRWGNYQKPSLQKPERRALKGFHCTVYDEHENPFMESTAANTSSFPGLHIPVGEGGFTLLSPVCRQLYEETATLPFEWNVFSFEHQSVFERYIMREKRLPLFQRRALRTLLIYNWRPTEAVVKYLGGLSKVIACHYEGMEEYDIKNPRWKQSPTVKKFV